MCSALFDFPGVLFGRRRVLGSPDIETPDPIGKVDIAVGAWFGGGFVTAVAAVVEFLKKNSTPVGDVKEIEQVGTIASNNDSEIGKKLAEAWEQSGGKDGVITIEEGRSLENEIETVEGMQLSGISTIVVTPPAKAARVPVFHPSQWARPGSLKWTWGSMTPGRMAFSPKSCSAREMAPPFCMTHTSWVSRLSHSCSPTSLPPATGSGSGLYIYVNPVRSLNPLPSL